MDFLSLFEHTAFIRYCYAMPNRFLQHPVFEIKGYCMELVANELQWTMGILASERYFINNPSS